MYSASRLEIERLDAGLDTVTWLEFVAVIDFCQNSRANLVSYVTQPVCHFDTTNVTSYVSQLHSKIHQSLLT